MPHICISIFPSAFSIESVGLGYATGFVVAANEMHSAGPSEFETDKEGDCFNAEEAAVDVIACSTRSISLP